MFFTRKEKFKKFLIKKRDIENFNNPFYLLNFNYMPILLKNYLLFMNLFKV